MPPKKQSFRDLDTGEVIELDPAEVNVESLGSSFMQGVTEAPEQFISSLGGIAPLAEMGANVLSGNFAEAAPTAAGLAGGIAGTSAGGYLGGIAGTALAGLAGPAAPLVGSITVPLGTTLGSYAGGTLGALTGQYGAEALQGGEMPTGQDIAYAFGQGAVPVVAGKTARKGLKTVFGEKGKGPYSLPERLEQRSIGAKIPQMAKSGKQLGIGEEGQIRLAESIKRVGQTGIYRENAGNPVQLRAQLRAEIADLEQNKIAPEIERLENLRQQKDIALKPSLKNTQKLIKKYQGSGEGAKVEAEARQKFDEIRAELGPDLNTMRGLNQSRRALNQAVFSPNDPLYLPEVQDALRRDIRESQLRYAKQLDPNNNLADYLEQSADRNEIVSKVLDPQVARETTEIPRPRDWWRTSGGFGVPLLTGAITKNPYYGLGALGTTTTLDYLYNNPKGQLMLAEILKGQPLRGIPAALTEGLTASQIIDAQRQRELGY